MKQRSLIVVKKTSGKTLSAYYRGQRVLFVPKSRHLSFYARVRELETVAALAEICVTVALQATRARLRTWLEQKRAEKSLPVPELMPLVSKEEKRAAELQRRGWPTFEEGMAMVFEAMIQKGNSHDESIQPLITGSSPA